MSYDDTNVFAKIISGDIKTDRVYEDQFLIVIKDINPVAPVHLLVIPKGRYTDYGDFIQKASDTEILNYFKVIDGLSSEISHGYRLVSNKGIESGQTVFHFHTHIISGDNLKAQPL